MLTFELCSTGHPLIWGFLLGFFLDQVNNAGYDRKAVNTLSWNAYVIFSDSEENVTCKMNTAGGLNPYLWTSASQQYKTPKR